MIDKPSLNILVAPLNWGLGHASRCIPIIKYLLGQGHKVCLASDGEALLLLQHEFPELSTYQLKSSKATYAKSRLKMNYKLGSQVFKLIRNISVEQKLLAEIAKKEQLDLIISDNRLGFRLAKVKSVVISHQLKMLSGPTTWLTAQLHAYFLNQFDEVWVPDRLEQPRLSGQLSEHKTLAMKSKFIGISSRMKPEIEQKLYKYVMILSGPEPLRSSFEEKLLQIFKDQAYPTLLVQGKVSTCSSLKKIGQIEVINFLTSKKLNKLINQAEIVICRSGYTSVLDMAKLGAQAFFVPTPGQFEQEYLAEYLQNIGLANYCNQNELSLNRIKEAKLNGFKNFNVSELQLDLDLLKST